MTSEDISQSTTLRELQLDELGKRFFEGDASESEWLPTWQPSRTERRAMRATFVMLAVSGIAGIAFMIYAHFIMPRPVDLARAAPAPTLVTEQPPERPD